MTFKSNGASVETLIAMLGQRRPAGSKTERKWIADYIAPLGVSRDKAGNLHKRIGETPVLWSCHTDTVHREGGAQHLKITGDIVSMADKSNCLGADDTAGAWLLREMILAEIPGLYIFHRGEESGGIGSSYIAGHTPDLLTGMRAAIAFDRRGTQSIITHQFSRCCSDVFARSLAAELGMKHEPDDTGLFTDTANYTDLIGECTNVSAGFANEHTAKETLDIGYLLKLRSAVFGLDVDSLKFERRPGDMDDDDYGWGRDMVAGRPSRKRDLLAFDWQDDDNDVLPRNKSLASIVRDHPDEVADFLEEYGISAEELLDACYMRGAAVRY